MCHALDKTSGSWPVVILPSRGHLIMSRDIFGYHNWRGPVDTWRVGTRDAALHLTMHRTATQQRIIQPKVSTTLRLRYPGLGYLSILSHIVLIKFLTKALELLIPYYTWRNWGSGGWHNFLKILKVISTGARVQIHLWTLQLVISTTASCPPIGSFLFVIVLIFTSSHV